MKKLLTLFVAFAVVFTLAGCEGKTEAKEVTVIDREGNEVVIPTTIERIVSTAPSNTEVIVGLGLASKLVAVDKYSPTEGLNEDISIINFREPDVELLISLEPDIVVASGHNKVGDEDPFKQLKDAGIAVVYIPTAVSLQGILDDIQFIGEVLNKESEATTMVEDLNTQFEEIRTIAANINNKVDVYFEIGEYSGTLYSVGNNTFLHEVIELVGGNNIYKDLEGWPTVSTEDIISKNPDVIISNQDWNTDIINSIMSREGFNTVDAVSNNLVFVVNGNRTSRGSQYIIEGIKEVAEALYPDAYDFN